MACIASIKDRRASIQSGANKLRTELQIKNKIVQNTFVAGGVRVPAANKASTGVPL